MSKAIAMAEAGKSSKGQGFRSNPRLAHQTIQTDISSTNLSASVQFVDTKMKSGTSIITLTPETSS